MKRDDIMIIVQRCEVTDIKHSQHNISVLVLPSRIMFIWRGLSGRMSGSVPDQWHTSSSTTMEQAKMSPDLAKCTLEGRITLSISQHMVMTTVWFMLKKNKEMYHLLPQSLH